MSAYTDAEVDAVHEFAWLNRDGIEGSGSSNGAKRLLDQIAPAIAARALREAAGVIFNGAGDPEQEFYDAGVSPWLMRRADEIERTP